MIWYPPLFTYIVSSLPELNSLFVFFPHFCSCYLVHRHFPSILCWSLNVFYRSVSLSAVKTHRKICFPCDPEPPNSYSQEMKRRMIARDLSWGHRVSELASAVNWTHLERRSLDWGFASIRVAHGHIYEDIFLPANWFGKTLHKKKNELQWIKTLNKTEPSRWKSRGVHVKI